MPRVYNRSFPGVPGSAIYVGRPTQWGNPFRIGVHGTREEVIAMYEARLLSNPMLLARVELLRGRDLVCHCAPLACHADVLLRLANGPERRTKTGIAVRVVSGGR